MKNFTILKAKEKKNDKSPDYIISGQVENQYQRIGGCWVREGQAGKYISCKLSDTFKGKKQTYYGFSIVEDNRTEEELEHVEAERVGDSVKQEIEANEIPI